MVNVSHNASIGSDEDAESCSYEVVSVKSLIAIDVLTVLIGQPVNGRLLWISLTSRRATDLLNFNLALFHNLQYLMSLVHLVLVIAIPQDHQKLLKVVMVYAQIGGPMSLTFISLERYVAVLHPTDYPLLKTYRYREVCAGAVWFCSVVTTLLVYIHNRNGSRKADQVLKTIPVVVMLTMIIVMLHCSFYISRALRRSGPGQDSLHPVKRKAFITVSATAAITLFCYIPVAAMQRADPVDNPKSQCLITPLIILFLSAASVVHPLFYLHTQGHLKVCRSKHG